MIIINLPCLTSPLGMERASVILSSPKEYINNEQGYEVCKPFHRQTYLLSNHSIFFHQQTSSFRQMFSFPFRRIFMKLGMSYGIALNAAFKMGLTEVRTDVNRKASGCYLRLDSFSVSSSTNPNLRVVKNVSSLATVCKVNVGVEKKINLIMQPSVRFRRWHVQLVYNILVTSFIRFPFAN